ncbi:MAG: threonine/serine exporter family protein [Steroidobacteraceae bacterium]
MAGETAPATAISAVELELLLTSATLLFENGQTTEKVAATVSRLSAALGHRTSLFPSWGELSVRTDGPLDCRQEIIAAIPAAVDMNKVMATMKVIDELCGGRINAAGASASLQAIGGYPPVGIARFALLAGVGAAALGVIFGAAHWLSLVLIALSAGMGACLRRWLAGRSHNLFVQPFCAALLAGAIGAVAVRLQLSSALRLIAVCPCMVLVPGPHLLNGALDLVRGRIPLGASRIGYAFLIILMICAGLLAGLSLGGVSLPASGTSHTVPLGYDVIAAGAAVAAYGTFFAMPWRLLPIPVLIGALAHACRWAVIWMGGGVAAGALVACLVVGVLITPIADRLRLPFAAFGFAAVVSLIPGVFLFRMAGGLVDLMSPGGQASANLFLGIVSDGMTATLIFFAMACGLIVPKLLIDHLLPFFSR